MVADARRFGWIAVGVGLVATLSVRIGDRSQAPPLYDGIILTEPYLWLDPPPDHPGGATRTSARIAVNGAANAIIVVATGEKPPQAQVLAEAGSLTLAPGATSLLVSITPIEPPATVQSGYVDGNVYAFQVVDQAGRAATAPASAYVSILLRAADPTDADATIERFDGTGWAPTNTSSGGDGTYLAIVTEFGDFAVVANGTSPYLTPTPAASTGPGATPSGVSSSPATTVIVPTPVPSAGPAEPVGPDDVPIAALVLAIAVAASGALVVARRALVRRRRARRAVRPGWRNRR